MPVFVHHPVNFLKQPIHFNTDKITSNTSYINKNPHPGNGSFPVEHLEFSRRVTPEAIIRTSLVDIHQSDIDFSIAY